MNVRRIVTEDSASEQWRMLLYFSYPPNIFRFMKSRGHEPSNDLVEFIAGCLRQGEAYFASARNAPLDISPLLLYYGLTNLMVSVVALKTGEKPAIRSHGMHLEIPGDKDDGFTHFIPDKQEFTETNVVDDPKLGEHEPVTGLDSVDLVADASMSTDHVPSGLAALCVVPNCPVDGGLSILAQTFSPDTKFRMGHPWTLEELLGSIPDLRDDFVACYPAAPCYVIPVELVRRRFATFERVSLSHLENFSKMFSGIEAPEMFLRMIKRYDEAYLPPQPAGYFVPLRRKLNGIDIGIYGIYGDKFLNLPHINDRDPNCVVSFGILQTPSPLIVLLMILYTLGYISRYRPEIWNPFVRNDTTGEKMVMERLQLIAMRYAPNLVLNAIYDERLNFVPPSQNLGEALEEHALNAKGVRNRSRVVGNHAPLTWSEGDLEGWVKDIVTDTLRRAQEKE